MPGDDGGLLVLSSPTEYCVLHELNKYNYEHTDKNQNQKTGLEMCSSLLIPIDAASEFCLWKLNWQKTDSMFMRIHLKSTQKNSCAMLIYYRGHW